VDKITGITWMPDDQFINENSGVNANARNASQYYPDFSEFTTLRYFPDSRAKNCYRFPVTPNATYQIRGTFFYDYYDNGTMLPSFQMAVDGTIVNSDFFTYPYAILYQEVTYVAQTNLTYLCLSRDSTNSVPFISAISLVHITDPLTIPRSCSENVTVNGTAAADHNLNQGFYYITQGKWNFNGGNKIIRYA
jgi:hypothetical protein